METQTRFQSADFKVCASGESIVESEYDKNESCICPIFQIVHAFTDNLSAYACLLLKVFVDKLCVRGIVEPVEFHEKYNLGERKIGAVIDAPWIPCTEKDGALVVGNRFLDKLLKGMRTFNLLIPGNGGS